MRTALDVGSRPCSCRRRRHETVLVAVTGGPGAGKTAVLEMARKMFCEHVAVLPEAAGIVFSGGFPRIESKPSRAGAQLAIFHVQRALEYLAHQEPQVAIALCDRGTLDGLAYWPLKRSQFFEYTGTSREEEMRRYAAVIHLAPPTQSGGYRQEGIRVESAEEARRIDARISAAWSGHPKLFHVASTDDFFRKASQALSLIRDLLPPCCREHGIELPQTW